MSSLSAWSSKYPSDNDNLTWSEIQNKHSPFYFFAGGKIVWKLCWKLGRHSLLKLTIVLSLSCETYSISWVKPTVGLLSFHQNGSVQDSKFSERLFPLNFHKNFSIFSSSVLIWTARRILKTRSVLSFF